MEVIIHENYAILPDAGMRVMMGADSGSGGLQPIRGRNTERAPIVRDPLMNLSFAYWGMRNDFPQQVIVQIAKSSIIGPTLDKKVCMAQGKSVLPVTLDWDEAGNQKISVVKDPEIWDFLDHPSTQKYFNEALTDLFWFYNVFPKLTYNVNHTKILKIETEWAAFCRWGVQNDMGLLDTVYVNANWPRAQISDGYTITYKAIDPYAYDLVREAKNINDDCFIYPVSYPTPGKVFYSLAHWDGIRQSGWMEVIEKIPKFKNYMMDNRKKVQFQIEFPDYYFDEKFGDVYKKAKPEEKSAMRTKELQAWNDFLSGVENAGKSIASIFKVLNGKDKAPGVTITPIPDNNKDGEMIDDNQEAMSNLLYALGLDPTLVGFAPGSKMGSGAGSDKREAFLIFLATVDPYRRKILEPLNFIAKYNGWKDKYPFLRFEFQDTILTTLDKGKGTETAVNTGQNPQSKAA